MNIIILGAGEIGLHMARLLGERGCAVTVIEKDERVAAEAAELLDARIVEGTGASVSTLEEAGIADCGAFFALTSSDTANLVAGSLAKALGARKAIVRVHADVQQEQWLFDFRTRFDADHLFSPARLAAVELAKYIRNPECLLVEEIARGRIELQQTRIEQADPAAGRPLRELKLPARVRVGLVQRGKDVIVPDGAEALQPGDVLTIFGAPRALEAAAAAFGAGEPPGEVRVVIFGGGGYGFALAQILEGAPRFRTRIFEPNPKRCAYLANVLQNTTLINADATSLQNLREERVGEADFFVAATGDDEDNLMTCLQAKDLGVRHCLTLVHRADYTETIQRAGERLGILGAVSPRIVTGRDLLRFATVERHHTLVELPGGVEILEFTVREGGSLEGKKVSEVRWPKGSGLVALTRGSSASVPVGEDELVAGDVIAAMVTPAARRAFLKLIE